ncbi:Hypothetical predicted protein [Paramuricea clavata]|uniref:Uncharacterized protein n=1 Tax=Paramuricea clavata TaxID=317549 RepID=A0A6S7G0P5_PARCT|nr:Hypothetical predicted protein [Paramuricea clavata]
MTLSGKIVLLLVVILSVAMVTEAGGASLWFGNQKKLYKGQGGKRDEVFDKTANDNGGVESILGEEGSGLYKDGESIIGVEKRWQ